MNEQQYLLTCISEEAVEVAKDATKAIRFGLYDMHKDNGMISNAVRLIQELNELIALVELAGTKGYLDLSMLNDPIIKNNKIMKYEKYAEYARQNGTLDINWDNLERNVCSSKDVNGICPHRNSHCNFPKCEE